MRHCFAQGDPSGLARINPVRSSGVALEGFALYLGRLPAPTVVIQARVWECSA